jgi:hypothetical protein
MPDQPQGINFRKIVENALSLLVSSVFIGACVIVWRGATTVDARVNKTENNVQTLISNLSTKLTAYEGQLELQSNQLALVCTELKNLKPLLASSEKPALPKAAPVAVDPPWLQRARRQDIQDQLLKK